MCWTEIQTGVLTCREEKCRCSRASGRLRLLQHDGLWHEGRTPVLTSISWKWMDAMKAPETSEPRPEKQKPLCWKCSNYEMKQKIQRHLWPRIRGLRKTLSCFSKNILSSVYLSILYLGRPQVLILTLENPPGQTQLLVLWTARIRLLICKSSLLSETQKLVQMWM